MTRHEAVEELSPSGMREDGNYHKKSLMDRLMIRHISSVALRLPEEFDGTGKAMQMHVHGESSRKHAVIHLEESMPQEGGDAVRYTDINLTRSSSDSKVLSDLSAERYVTDDIAELMGAPNCSYESYWLGARKNTLSLINVMRSVGLAARTLDEKKQMSYLCRPEASNLEQIY